MTSPQRIVVTGASGFLGRSLVAFLARSGREVLALSRSGQSVSGQATVESRRMPDLADPAATWDDLLRSGDVVIHLAGLAHGSLEDKRHDSINHRGTVRLVQAAQRARVARLIFISSIAAQTGPATTRVLTEDDEPRPANAYGRAKLAAERAVADSGVSFTILRPGVVYGENAKGNLRLLEQLAGLRLPLPFAGIQARRSLLSAASFNSAVDLVLANDAATNKLFLVADPVPLSVADMIAQIRRKAGRRPGLFYVPPRVLKTILIALGLKRIWMRIGEPFVISTQRLQAIGWSPPGSGTSMG